MPTIPAWLPSVAPTLAVAGFAVLFLTLWLRKCRLAEVDRADAVTLRQHISYVTGQGPHPDGERDVAFLNIPEAWITEWKPARAFGRRQIEALPAASTPGQEPGETATEAPRQRVRFILVEPKRDVLYEDLAA